MIQKFEDLHIDIHGTYEEPLFKAKDIGALLEIEKIRDTISNLDDSCKILKAAQSAGGIQEQWFLTEKGLYKILMISRKPIAQKFQNWIFDVIREIRLKGKYELEAKIKELEQKSQELAYEEVNKPEIVYVFTTDIIGVYKIGKTLNINARKSASNTLLTYEIEIVYQVNTNCARLVEEIVHFVLDHYRSNSNRELFRCDINYIKMVIDIVTNTVDTLKSSYQSISRDQLFSTLNSKINTNYIPVRDIHETNKFYKWLDANIEEADSNDHLDLKILCERYLNKTIVEPKTSSKYKKEMEYYIKNKYPNIEWRCKQHYILANRPRGWFYLKFK